MKVTTQNELDAALAKPGYAEISIDSPRGVWLTISANEGKYVGAYGSATVRAYGSATVRAYGSATVEAYDSATVEAYDSATVRAYGSATVEAYDSATVEAYDSATVEAYGSATVEAYGSATVRAYGSATVRATPYVAVHLFSARVTHEGGVIIDVASIDRSDWSAWAAFHGVEILGAKKSEDDELVVFKAVDDDLKSGRGFKYPIGETVTDPDWKAGDFCGNGLHFSPHPHQARQYFRSATRFLKVAVKVSELTIIAGNGGDVPKLKAKSARVLAEVDIDGKEVTR
jgi:hypothetical protein